MTTAAPPGRGVSPLQPAPRPEPPRKTIWPIELYRSAVGKKYVMAITGLVLMGYVLAHMVGNLKLYLTTAPSSTSTRSGCATCSTPRSRAPSCCGSCGWACWPPPCCTSTRRTR